MSEVYVVMQKIWKDNDTFVGVAKTFEDAIKIRNKKNNCSCPYPHDVTIHKVPFDVVFRLSDRTMAKNE